MPREDYEESLNKNLKKNLISTSVIENRFIRFLFLKHNFYYFYIALCTGMTLVSLIKIKMI